jgi:hypothetical protein
MSSTNDHTRVGSFADGQADAASAHAPTGQFCTGQEQLSEVADPRVGGFADGQSSTPAGLHPKGRFSRGQERATHPHAPHAVRSLPPHPAYAEGEG